MINQILNISTNNMTVVSLGFDELSGWTARVQIELSRGAQLEINGQAVVLDRLREYYTMQLSVAEMQALLGENYDAVLFAVQNGEYSPDGDVAAGLIAEAALRLGASGE